MFNLMVHLMLKDTVFNACYYYFIINFVSLESLMN